MIIKEMAKYLPPDWYSMDLLNQKYELIPVEIYTDQYMALQYELRGKFNLGVEAIYKVQNPHLYMKYQIRMEQYQRMGPYVVRNLFHDTPASNVDNICTYNFDWKCGVRFKYGPGVYFSPSSELANAYSHKQPNGYKRAMFFVDVLVGRVQIADPDLFLPEPGYDTVESLNGATVCKYFDNEYYPTFVAIYHSYT